MIYYKEKYLKVEFEKLNDKLIAIMEAMSNLVEAKYGDDVTITSVYREDLKSSHMYFRAVDASVRLLEHKKCKYIEHLINIVFPYDKIYYQTAIYHNAGSGWHFHIQVKA